MQVCVKHISATWTNALPQNGMTAKAPVVAGTLFGNEAYETGNRLIV